MNIKKFLKILSVCTLVMYAGSANAILLLSGDGNITSDLGVFAADNDTFFTNVLQGGSTVTVHDGNIGGFTTSVNNFYNSLGGVSSSIVGSGSTITDATLAGSDLFISILPEDTYAASEISAMSTFLSGGGSIFFLGENNLFDTYNSFINTALSGLGSLMSITLSTPFFDLGLHTATGSQIASDALTAGVTGFQYGAPSEVNGGTTLFFGTGGEAFVSYESVSVPEPATLALFGIGLAGLGFARRKKKSA